MTTHLLPMGVIPSTPPDLLGHAIAFQAQSAARVAEAKMIECVTRYFTRGQKSRAVDMAAESVLAATITLDAANHELADTVREEMTRQIMAAVRAMESEHTDGVPKSHAVASSPDEVHDSAVAASAAPRTDAHSAQHPAHPADLRREA